MKALTCAGYEYKKLMVAELQRQLDELEDLQKSEYLFIYILNHSSLLFVLLY